MARLFIILCSSIIVCLFQFSKVQSVGVVVRESQKWIPAMEWLLSRAVVVVALVEDEEA